MGDETVTRVLHVLNGPGGGSTLSTIEIATAMGRLGFEAHAVCQSLYGTAGERRALLDAYEGRVVFAPLYLWHRRTRTQSAKRALLVARQEVLTAHGLRSAGLVRSIADERRIELIHSATFVVPDGAIAARSLGLPHLFHVRELVGPGQPFRIAGEGRRLARALGRPGQQLVANSTTTGDLLTSAVPGLDVAVIPNGLDLTRFEAVASSADPGSPVRVVAMVANLNSTWKRHDLFVDAAAIVARSHPEIEFRIYGHRPDGPSAYVDALRKRAADQGLTTLTLSGFVADPATMMGECDVVVQPTRAESFGRVVVEAMASKVAVVGVAEGPLGELVEHERSGLLADSDTPVAIAEVISRIVEDHGLRSAVVAGAQERAGALFSIDRCAERLAVVYEDLLRIGPLPREPLARSWSAVAAGRFFG